MNSRLWSSLLASATTIMAFPAFAGSSSTDYPFMVEQVWYNCQHFGEAYQEISIFETTNFYVSICQKGDQYFYFGTAKNKSVKSHFIPAYLTDQFNTYQADDGNNSYIVEIKPPEAILKIQRNGNTVVVETALLSNCPQVSYDLRTQISQKLNYSAYQFISINDYSLPRFRRESSLVHRNLGASSMLLEPVFLNSNQVYTLPTNILNQLDVTDIFKPQEITSVTNHLSSFVNCF